MVSESRNLHDLWLVIDRGSADIEEFALAADGNVLQLRLDKLSAIRAWIVAQIFFWVRLFSDDIT
jgi:hypothetical protein